MRADIYELAALVARYWFALLSVIIVARAWRMTIVDNRRAKTLRNIALSSAQLGEMVVTRGSAKARRGMKYPIFQEGMIGSAARADIRIRAAGVRKRHAHFKLQPDGLLLTAIGGAPLSFADGRSGKKLLVSDGDSVVIGRATLLCVLFDGQTDQVHERVSAPPQKERYDQYDFDEYDPFDDAPQPRRRSAGTSARDGGSPRSRSKDAELDDPFMMDKPDAWQAPRRRRR